MGFEVYACGTRGSFPSFGKEFSKYGQATSCYVIRDGDYAIVMDCGSGLVMAQKLLAGCRKVDVLLSHVHYDHVMGLFQHPQVCEGAEVTFYGNFTDWRKAEEETPDILYKIDELTACGERIAVEADRIYVLGKGFSVYFKPSNHGDGTMMIFIRKDGKRLCFTGDYEHSEISKLVDWINGFDVVLFDGSYTDNEYQKYRGWGHSSWEDGARIALAAEVGLLIITHHSPGKTDEELQREERKLQEIMPNAFFIEEGTSIEL